MDHGSTDETAVVVRRVAADLETALTLISLPQNRGKGHAVKTGMLRARGQTVLMTDADLSTPIEDLAKLRSCMRDGVDGERQGGSGRPGRLCRANGAGAAGRLSARRGAEWFRFELAGGGHVIEGFYWLIHPGG